MCRRIVPFVTGVLLFVCNAASAQAPDLLTLGRQEFETGERELNLGHYEKALEHFENSYRMTAKPALLFNLAYVNRQIYEKTRDLSYLRATVERYRGFLENTKTATEPKIVNQRPKAEKELKAAEDELARELASRARVEEALNLAEDFLRQGRLVDAKLQLDRYANTPNNERAGVVRMLLVQAAIALAENHPDIATDAYGAALELDKSVALPAGAPEPAQKAFADAQSRIGSTPAFAVSHNAPASHKLDKPLELVFTATPDPMHIVRGIQFYYRAGAGAYSSLPQPQPITQNAAHIGLPKTFTAALLPGSKIEYYASVVDSNGAILQHLGTASLPYVVAVEKPTTNVAKKWWFWTATGGVVAVLAGGAGLTYYLLNPPPVEVPIQTESALRAFPGSGF
jgi:hypothetical protein